jgi:hypothetical protein
MDRASGSARIAFDKSRQCSIMPPLMKGRLDEENFDMTDFRKTVSVTILAAGVCTAFSASANAAAHATAPLFDANASCKATAQLLAGEDASARNMALGWAFGYRAGQTGGKEPVIEKDVAALIGAFAETCKDETTTTVDVLNTLLGITGEPQIVAEAEETAPAGEAKPEARVEKAEAPAPETPVTRGPAEPAPAVGGLTGDPIEAVTLMAEFAEDGADHRALTLALKPNPEEIAALFSEPLATKLIAYVELIYAQGGVRPKAGRTELLLDTFSKTEDLTAGAPIMDTFPGAYEQLTPYFKPGNTVVRIKFVEPGETAGDTVEGIFFVNGRWVLLPKAWRALEN